ncbi:hypothetical protein F5B22DRAFT_649694 [Xylaria bambusicola]|uniref:uncharacterized protein n=1 Tax=Xylaria bambusicola TaxID=326684 RepID=UPI0020081BFE|nr:uncharacterized protein F5B22DRAFT_649694 [Xylaria bambusicola]KAI0508798.1 hypothetical protein F5B22DRAFT_649694 [Xylaria bambusicola]
MPLQTFAILSLLALGISASARIETTQSLYGQCGGLSYNGPTKCPKTATCYNDGTNPWYSQCVITPWDNGGGKPTSTVVTTTKTSTTPGGVITIITTLPPVTKTLTPDDPFTEHRTREDVASPTDETAADVDSSNNSKRQSGPGTTLQSGWYWVRAVASPNYHKYLQTKPTNNPGTAILESYRTAGQYKIEGGQLMANTGTGTTALYLHVEKPADFTQRKLATWFNTTKNDFGTFAWQGDALTWSTAEVKRQNLAAWLVCASQALFINTGAYAYQTPAGCADQTIHYYNDAHANE